MTINVFDWNFHCGNKFIDKSNDIIPQFLLLVKNVYYFKKRKSQITKQNQKIEMDCTTINALMQQKKPSH